MTAMILAAADGPEARPPGWGEWRQALRDHRNQWTRGRKSGDPLDLIWAAAQRTTQADVERSQRGVLDVRTDGSRPPSPRRSPSATARDGHRCRARPRSLLH